MLQILHGLGGECLLYPNLIELVKNAKENGIRNKLITNGKLLAEDEQIREIVEYLDSLTLSIDTTSDIINYELGRGENHFSNITTVLDYLKKKNISITINTVVSQKNIDNGSIEKLGEFLRQYNISHWRIFKFMPLRETAQLNKAAFEVSDEQFEMSKSVFRKFSNIPNIEFRTEKDMEDKYILILPDANIVKTHNGQDVILGNALKSNLHYRVEQIESREGGR